MGVSNKQVYHALLVLYLAGLIYSALFMFGLPDLMMKEAGFINLNNIEMLEPVLIKMYWIVGSVMLLGLTIMLVSLLKSDRNQQDEDSESKEVSVQAEGASTGKEVEETFNSEQILGELDKLRPNPEKPSEFAEKFLSELCSHLQLSQGAFYWLNDNDDKKVFELFSSYALSYSESQKITYEIGEGLVGQVAKSGKPINISSVPEGYITILSGLGKASPSHLYLGPVLEAGRIVGVIELSSFTSFTSGHETLINKALDKYAEQMKKITRTEKPVEPVDNTRS